MINLKCPSCGGTLELPDELKVAHCMFCGAKILIDDYKRDEFDNYGNYIELAKSALVAKNYGEAITYCNKVLEINPKNIESWINKAEATFWLSTRNNQRYDEAMEYFSKAEKLALDTELILKKKKEITNMQALWLNNMGLEELKNAIDFYERMSDGGLSDISLSAIAYRLDQVERAKKESTNNFIEAMIFFVQASDYAPDDINILRNIDICYQKADWIQWSEKSRVKEKLNVLEKLEHKQAVENGIAELKQELTNTKEKLEKTRSKELRKGFLSKIFGESEEKLVSDIEYIKKEIKYREDLLKNEK